MTRKIEVLPHNPRWKELFRDEAEQIGQALGDEAVAIHHIGSTAIPGISAKPILDILIEVKDIRKVNTMNPRMEALGYKSLGEYGIPGRRFFVKGGDENRSHHVHIFQQGDPEVERHLNFRDFLTCHPVEALEYSRLKEDLARQFPTDIGGYMEGKNGMIQVLERRAMIWKALRTPLLELETPRLRLAALNSTQLEAYLDSPQDLEAALGLDISSGVLNENLRRAIGIKLQKMLLAAVEDHPWFTYWLIILRDMKNGAGLIGFKGAPNSSGAVEIGYGIDERFQRKGYMTEAARAMVGWAFADRHCMAVTASVDSQSNIASKRVLEKIGMQIVDETEPGDWIITRGHYLISLNHE